MPNRGGHQPDRPGQGELASGGASIEMLIPPRIHGSHLTRRWRETDSNSQSRDRDEFIRLPTCYLSAYTFEGSAFTPDGLLPGKAITPVVVGSALPVIRASPARGFEPATSDRGTSAERYEFAHR